MSSAPRISLRGTGLAIFGSRIVSVFTGLAFVVMAARWLGPGGLGLWEFIVDLVAFASYPVSLVAFWATRDVARGKGVGRTAVILSLAMSAGGVGVYFVFTLLTYQRVSGFLLPFLLGSLLVPLGYLSQVSGAIILGHRPSMQAYAVLAAEIPKLLVAYVGLYIYRAGIDAVILALFASYFAQASVSAFVIRGVLREGLDLAQGRRWLKLAWLPALSTLPSVVGIADTFVASLLFGTTIVGYYQSAFLVAGVVGYSTSLAYSLYPLMLRGGSTKLPAITLEFALLFGLPMAVGASVLASPILFLLGPRYVIASPAMSVLAAFFVITIFSTILDQTLLGTEKVDEEGGRTFGDYAKSNLLFVPVANLSSIGIYIVTMVGGLAYAFATNLTPASSVLLWTGAQLLGAVVSVALKLRRARGVASIQPGPNVLGYAGAAGLMGVAVYFISGLLLSQGLGTVDYGFRLIALIVGGGALYMGVVYLVNAQFRALVRALLSWREG